MKEMTVHHERSKNKELKVTRGWYSEADMRDDLNWKAQHGPNIFRSFTLSHMWQLPTGVGGINQTNQVATITPFAQG